MRHIVPISVSHLQKAQIETTGLSLGQILSYVASILSIIAQAITVKEGTTTTTTPTTTKP